MSNVLDAILKLGSIKRYSANEDLFIEGDEIDGFYYVSIGTVKIYKFNEQGKEIEIGRMEQGDFIGEAAAFASKNYPVSAQTTSSCTLVYFAKSTIQPLLGTNLEVNNFFIQLLAQKCIALNKKLESLSLKTVKQRLIEYFLMNCPGDCGKCERTITLPIKKVELAKFIGTISETLSRTLNQLEKKKLIIVKGKQITVLDCTKLKKEALGLML